MMTELNNLEGKKLNKPEPTSNFNKKTSRVIELQKMLEHKFQFNVVEELLALYQNPETKPADKRQILTDLMRYLYPQLKAIELDQKEGEKISVNIVFPEKKETPEVTAEVS